MSWFVAVNLILGLVALTYYFIYRKTQYFQSRGVPCVEPEFYYGNSRGIGRDYHLCELIKKLYLKLKPEGPVAGLYLYTSPALMITDLGLVKQVLVKDFNNFPNRGRYFNSVDDPLSAHLVNIEDEEWKSLRNKLTPTFTSGKIKMMFDIVSQLGDKLVETIEREANKDNRALEVKSVFSRFTTDVIASCAFGIDSNSLDNQNSKFFEMGTKALGPRSFFKRNFFTNYRKLGNFLRVALNPRDVIDFYLGVVQGTIQHRKDNPQIQRNDFMTLLLNLKDPELTFHQIAAQCQVFFTAGFETTSTTLTYCLFELSQNIDLQEKARQSVIQALKRHKNELNYESVSQMEYLEQCVKETLRKTPPSFRLDRIARQDYKIPNTDIIIEKGTQVFIPIAGIHADPDIYPNPQKFDPDRFTPEEEAKRHPFAFIPFGEGPRVCIGMRFAMVEVKIALSKILLKYRLGLDRTRTSVPLKISPNKLVIMQPAEGIFIKFNEI